MVSNSGYSGSLRSVSMAAGILLIVRFGLGILVNMILIGPLTFSKDYLTLLAANSQQAITGMLLSMLLSLLAVILAVQIYPLLKLFSKAMAICYVSVCIIQFGLIAVDNLAISSMLAVSRQAVSADAGWGSHTGAVFAAAREFAHLVSVLFGFIAAFLLSAALISTPLIPRFLSVWGILAAVLGVTEIILNIYGFHHKASFLMLLPMGIQQLVLGCWLMIRGFKMNPAVSTPE